ncbi:MAG: bifunctional 4-hydroxy-3-methylbut-2-enyl diphosphate reductase/30S ribosomal protein S1 [Bacillota bacterium]
MKIILDSNAGFCFGVKRAVDKVKELAENTRDMNIYTYGPLIHNKQVIESLSQKGVQVAEDLYDIRSENTRLVIRSHGVPEETYRIIEKKNLDYVDCTCPYVANIHRIVKEQYEKGCKIFIVGDSRHPEVIGINGWCGNSATIIDDEKVVDKLPNYDKICLVAQTTITQELWNKVADEVLKKYNNVEVFNTICSATEIRQNSASELSRKVDCMLVVGSRDSSNTNKLFSICSKNCQNVFLIETAAELPINKLRNFNEIGITAGASTPDWIIKEVISKMDELIIQDQEKMMEEYEKSMKSLYPGETVTGTVIMVTDDEVMVNIGYKSDGIIKKDDYTWDSEMSLKDLVKAGDEVEVKVVSINDGEGNVVLSKKLVDADKNWYKIEYAYNEKAPVEGYVKEIVKGGAIVEIYGIRCFMPASQFELRYTEDLTKYVNTKIKALVLEYDKEKRKVVLSRKNFLKIEKDRLETEVWSKIEPGQKLTGEVKRLADFGVFVDIGGVDGLIHISELSWTRVKHPSEVVKPGQKVEVVVLSADKDKKKISLGLKQTIADPWTLVSEKYKAGDIVEVKVLRFSDFGAFVEVEPGIDGLVHVSQIADRRIAKPSDALKLGEIVKAKIVEIKAEEKKISLSIKEAEGNDKQEEEKTEE